MAIDPRHPVVGRGNEIRAAAFLYVSMGRPAQLRDQVHVAGGLGFDHALKMLCALDQPAVSHAEPYTPLAMVLHFHAVLLPSGS